MESPNPRALPRTTGLPPGVEAGPVGRRLLAHVVDLLVPVAIGTVMIASLSLPNRSSVAILVGLGSLIMAAWIVLVWSMFATRAAGPGMRLMRLQLVGLKDGRPIGWGRFFVRTVVLFALTITVLPLIAMIVMLLRQPRRQGWHDLAANAVVIKARPLAPTGPRPVTQSRSTSLARPATVKEPSLVSRQTASPAYASNGHTHPSLQSRGPQGYANEHYREDEPSDRRPSDRPRVGTGGGTGGQERSASPSGAARPGPRPELSGSSRLPSSRGSDTTPTAGTRLPAPLPSSVPTVRPGAVAGLPELGGEPEPVTMRQERIGEGQAAPTHEDETVGPGAEDSRPLNVGWAAALDDGREIDVTGLVLLGRNPQPRPGEEDAEMIKVADDTRTVSKTHLALGVDANGMYVMDRGSTNGSTVTNTHGVSKTCPAGDIVPVTPGSIISFGDHWLEIRRHH